MVGSLTIKWRTFPTKQNIILFRLIALPINLLRWFFRFNIKQINFSLVSINFHHKVSKQLVRGSSPGNWHSGPMSWIIFLATADNSSSTVGLILVDWWRSMLASVDLQYGTANSFLSLHRYDHYSYIFPPLRAWEQPAHERYCPHHHMTLRYHCWVGRTEQPEATAVAPSPPSSRQSNTTTSTSASGRVGNVRCPAFYFQKQFRST